LLNVRLFSLFNRANGKPYRSRQENADLSKSSSRKQPAPEIEIGENREITHPLVIRTNWLLRHTTKDQRGILVPNEDSAAHVKLTVNTLPRALRLLDGLFCAVENHGHTLNWPKEPKANLE
jgi:hypothetical protein